MLPWILAAAFQVRLRVKIKLQYCGRVLDTDRLKTQPIKGLHRSHNIALLPSSINQIKISLLSSRSFLNKSRDSYLKLFLGGNSLPLAIKYCAYKGVCVCVCVIVAANTNLVNTAKSSNIPEHSFFLTMELLVQIS